VESGQSLEELTPVYRRWEIYSLPLLFAFIPPLAATWWWILYWIGTWNAQRFSDAVYHLWPTGITWAVPAFLLAALTASVPIKLFYRWHLRERYSKFERYLNLRHGYNQESATVPIYAFFGTSVLAFIVLVLHWRVMLTNDEIVQYPFFSLSSVSHKYREITDIKTAPKRRAPNGNLRDNDDYQTAFADGLVWLTYPNPADLTAAEKRQMMEFVSKQSGKPIRHVPVLERGR
jgi:hypothetical protein